MARDRPYHHGALRSALIDAAQAILAERGADALTLRECARRIGVSHAAPKHHFPDKTALLTAVAAAGYRDLTRTMDAHAQAAGDDPAAVLRAVGLGYIAFAIENPGAFRLMFGGTTLHQDDAELVAAADAAFDRLNRAMTRMEGANTAGRGDARRMTAWSAVHGFATLWLAGRLQTVFDVPDTADGALTAADRMLGHLWRWEGGA